MRTKSIHVPGIFALVAFAGLAGCRGDSSEKPEGTTQPPDTTKPVDTTRPVDTTKPMPTNQAFDQTKKTVTLSTGIDVAYVEAGKAGGPAVLLLHGFTDTSRSFFPTIEALVNGGTDLHVYALDARGHGGSSMPKGENCAATPEQCFEIADMAADVLAFMDQQKIQKAHVVGHSMGSMVAQEIGLTSPDRVASLTLIGTFVTGLESPAIHQFLMPQIEGAWKDALAKRAGFKWPQDAYALTPRDADPNAEAWMSQVWVSDPVANPDFLAEIIPETTNTKLGTWIGAVRNFAKFDNRERLKQLTVPTLVIWATQDALLPHEPDQAAVRAALDAAVEACNTRYAYKTYGKAALPKSGMQEKDLGHNTQWGAPEAVAADVTAWIETGKPTTDLPYADPADVRKVSVELGAAQLIEKAPAENCTPPAQ